MPLALSPHSLGLIAGAEVEAQLIQAIEKQPWIWGAGWRLSKISLGDGVAVRVQETFRGNFSSSAEELAPR